MISPRSCIPLTRLPILLLLAWMAPALHAAEGEHLAVVPILARWSGISSRTPLRSAVRLHTQSAWEAAWHEQSLDMRACPQLDFTQLEVLAITAGDSDDGVRVREISVTAHGCVCQYQVGLDAADAVGGTLHQALPHGNAFGLFLIARQHRAIALAAVPGQPTGDPGTWRRDAVFVDR